VSDVLDVMLDDIVCGRMGGQAGGRKEEGADTALKNKKTHVNVGKYMKIYRNLVIIKLYLRLPMYAIIAFSGIVAGGIFSASEQILHFSHVAYVCRF